MKAILLAAALLFSFACGPDQAKTPAASPTPTPMPTQPLLFAVLEANGAANALTYNAVVIAGLDGHESARATFAPMPVPAVGCMGAILPASAHVAAGKVFYADAKGVVRSLATNGTVAVVATFPMTSTHQMLSFAVSPDGSRVLGTVFTIPANAFACDGSQPNTTYTFDAYAAAAGGTSTLVYHQSWPKPQSVMALTGWDSVGPIGTYPTVWASQGGGPGSTLGVKVRVDATTVKPGAPFSDPSKCLAWDSNQSGSFVCTEDGVITNGGTAQQQVAVPVSVRRADGGELWHYTATGQNGPSTRFLAPDGRQVLMCCADTPASTELVFASDGTKSTLGSGFIASGWLDGRTAIGEVHSDPLQQPPLPLGYVSLTASGTVVPLGLTGLFVGTVRA